MNVFELATENHPLMLTELEKYITGCRKMIQEIEYEFLNEYLTDEEEEINYTQLDTLVTLIAAFRAKIKQRSFLYN